MASSGDLPVLTRSRPGRRARRQEQRQDRPGQRATRAGGPLWVPAVPALAMLVTGLWGITGASYWRDESATLVAAGRPFGSLVRMLGHVDAVHGAYYLIMWPLVRLAGPGELVTRFPSAVAMAVAAGLVAALGSRLVSPAAGLAAGLLLAAIPAASVYAQDARSYAMVTALGTAASYLLARLTTAPGRRLAWLAGYAACLAAMGLLNIFGLLIIPAHAVTVAVACRGAPRGRPRRSLGLGWLAAAALAAAVASPVVLLAWAERSQLAWLVTPGPRAVSSLRQLAGTGLMPVALGVILACGVLFSALAGRAVLRASWPAPLLALALPWLLLPPGLLLAASQATPLYTLRYVVFCLPAVALLAGTALSAVVRAFAGDGAFVGGGLRPPRPPLRPARPGRCPGLAGRIAAGVGWAAGAAGLVTVALFGLQGQAGARGQGGHSDDIRRADQIIAARMRPGDAVIYNTPSNENLQAYRYGMIKLADIGLHQGPVGSDTLAGIGLPGAVVRLRIQGVPRLWVIQLHHPRRLPVLQGLGLRLVHRWHPRDVWLLLYAQHGSLAGRAGRGPLAGTGGPESVPSPATRTPAENGRPITVL
ncbi:MAG TPA: glycosyltransferase family 39 protein [Streptosporangiaceae bacterium]|jgi:mannosyltransferase